MGPRDDERFAKLPDISTFTTAKSDRFIVDMDDVTGGHPFKGLNATGPTRASTSISATPRALGLEGGPRRPTIRPSTRQPTAS